MGLSSNEGRLASHFFSLGAWHAEATWSRVMIGRVDSPPAPAPPEGGRERLALGVHFQLFWVVPALGFRLSRGGQHTLAHSFTVSAGRREDGPLRGCGIQGLGVGGVLRLARSRVWSCLFKLVSLCVPRCALSPSIYLVLLNLLYPPEQACEGRDCVFTEELGNLTRPRG